MTHAPSPATAGLSTLIVLQVVMLGSLYAGVAPHPPATTPLFGIGPFIGAAIAAAIAALALGPSHCSSGRALSGLAAAMALVSFGPQKYLDPQFPLIWPAVLTGQIAVLSILVTILKRPTAPSTQPGGHVA